MGQHILFLWLKYHLFITGRGVLTVNWVSDISHDIFNPDYMLYISISRPLKFDRRLGSTLNEVPVKFQSY